MGCTGSFMVRAMTAVRMRADAAFELPPTAQPIAGTGLGWLCVMGLSSNARYSAVHAAEDILYARCAFALCNLEPSRSLLSGSRLGVVRSAWLGAAG